MKFKVHMKDPDTLIDAVTDAVKDSVKDIVDQEEREAVRAVRYEKQYELASEWFEYGEYLTVEVDTEAGTCTVVKPA